MTNIEKIRSKSDEELAVFMHSLCKTCWSCPAKLYCESLLHEHSCTDVYEMWLKEEEEDA